jgi:hypothetical protein
MKERKKIGWANRLYRALKRSDYPPGYQVLCANCNIIKVHENKELQQSRDAATDIPLVSPRCFPRWSVEEQQILQENFGKISISELAVLLLGRTKNAIRQQAYEHNLVKHRNSDL